MRNYVCRKIDFIRRPNADLGEKFQPKLGVQHFVPANGAHRSHRLMSLASFSSKLGKHFGKLL